MLFTFKQNRMIDLSNDFQFILLNRWRFVGREIELFGEPVDIKLPYPCYNLIEEIAIDV